MKKIFLLLLVVFALFTPRFFVKAEGTSEGEEALEEKIEELLSSLDTKELEEYLSSLEENFLDGGTLKEKLLSLVKGGLPVEEGLTSFLLSAFQDALSSFLSVFAPVLCVCILDGILLSLRGSFLSDSATSAVHYACFAAILALLLTCVIPLFTSVKGTVSSLEKQMQLVFPILITLMAGSGGAVSASIYRPSVAFLSQTIIQMIVRLIFPIGILIICFTMVGNLSGKINVSGFIKLLSDSAKWILGISFALYSVTLTVQGIAAGTYDGLSLKAMKYAIGSGVPLIGGFLSGGVDLVLAGSVLIKNSLGLFSIALLLITVLPPFLSLLAFNFFLKLTVALSSPVADPRICGFLEGVSGGVGYFTAGLLAVAFAYFVTLLLLICSSGVLI